MKTIDVHTKISSILKEHPDALEAIISISPRFNKLRNPLLRKIMASRTTISTASKIGGCSVEDFFEKLKPLGFEIDDTKIAQADADIQVPDFMKKINAETLVELDVRAMLEGGNDPFQLILQKVNALQANQILKLINTFEPLPLIQILEKKGFQTYSETISENLVNTYFYNTSKVQLADDMVKPTQEEWDKMLEMYSGKLIKIDVREMEMPLPMLTILDELEKLPPLTALYVFHKRIPVFLLPELQERKFHYLIKELSDAEVHLIIYPS